MAEPIEVSDRLVDALEALHMLPLHVEHFFLLLHPLLRLLVNEGRPAGELARLSSGGHRRVLLLPP